MKGFASFIKKSRSGKSKKKKSGKDFARKFRSGFNKTSEKEESRARQDAYLKKLSNKYE